jgi:hypothetical protein
MRIKILQFYTKLYEAISFSLQILEIPQMKVILDYKEMDFIYLFLLSN